MSGVLASIIGFAAPRQQEGNQRGIIGTMFGVLERNDLRHIQPPLEFVTISVEGRDHYEVVGVICHVTHITLRPPIGNDEPVDCCAIGLAR